MGNIGVHSGAFRSQSAIVSAFFSSNCSFVGENAFKDCVSLTEINNSNVIEEIGSNAFAGTQLISATFEHLTSLHTDAFKGCYSLNYISMPNCNHIASRAFEECISLSSIDIPAYANFTIDENAFNCCSSLKSVNIANNNTVIKINNGAFKNCVKLSNIKLDNCIEIGSSAFYNCKNIKEITLSKCSSIKEHTFFDCSGLIKVYIKYINNEKENEICELTNANAFYMTDKNGKNIQNSNINFFVPPSLYDYYIKDKNWSKYIKNIIKMIEGHQIIYKTSDNNCVGIENSDTTNAIGYTNRYFDTYGLIEFYKDNNPNTLLELNYNIFKGATNLISVELPNECNRISEYEFSGCVNLETISLPANLKHIDNFAFENCTSLISFTIPQSVESLGEGIFAGCVDIENLSGKFVTSDKLSVVYGDKLICVIPEDNRRKINISDDIDGGIEILGAKCFYGCESLRRVDISESITEIGDNAFEGCINLREVHFHGDLPTIGYRIFGDIVRDDFKIFIPEEKIKEYHNNDKGNLGYYKNYIYPMPKENSLIYYSKDENIPNSILANQKTNPFTNKYYYYTLSNTLTNIPKGHFDDDKSVTDIILGENITEIGASAFSECTNLSYIYLSDNITKLGERCFFGCESLKSIHIPERNNTFPTFGSEIFLGCTSLKEFNTYYKENTSDDGRCYITKTKKYKTLRFFASGDLADGEKEYTIPDGITNIGNSAFRESNITSVSLNSNTQEIGAYAFCDCKSLKNISNLDNIEKISNYAFCRCKSLGKIHWANKLESIGNSAFEDCINMDTNWIPYNVTSIGTSAFKGCVQFMNDKNNTGRTLELNSITQINESTFQGCTSLKNVYIGDKIKSIGTKAFFECEKLEEVKTPDNTLVSDIGNDAFNGCTSLNTLDLSNIENLTYIGDYAFNGCENYKYDLNLPSTVNFLGRGCFSGSGINNLTIGYNVDSLSNIPVDAFKGCESLESISIFSQKIKTINSYSFNGCSNLTSITISSPITTIGQSAFEGCSALTNMHHIENLNEFPKYPRSEQKLPNLPNGSIISLSNYLPNTVTEIGYKSFYGCSELRSKPLVLPKYLEKLGDLCFATDDNTSLSIVVPFEIELSNPPSFSVAGAKPFGEQRVTLTINIPEAYINTYKSDTDWKYYSNSMVKHKYQIYDDKFVGSDDFVGFLPEI